jgi:tRNA pseudouridine38-40 synthase
LDLGKMEKCLSFLVGKHDFSSFRSSGSGNINPIREIIRAEIYSSDKNLLHFLFEANGFLRHMVRNIVGTVVEAGQGRMNYNEFVEIFQSRNRQLAGIKASPQGLFLRMVKY